MPWRIFALCFNCIVFVREVLQVWKSSGNFCNNSFFFNSTYIDRCNLFCHFGDILKSTLFLLIISLLKCYLFKALKKFGNKLSQISYCFKTCCNLVDLSHLVVFISNVSYNFDLLSCLSEPFVLVKWDYSAVDKHNKILPRKYLIFMFHCS